MESTWIKYTMNLPEKPEIRRMQRSLGCSNNEIVGAVMKVWSWADRETRDGMEPDTVLADIDHIGQIIGLADALVEVGWVAIMGPMGLKFVNFGVHCGKTAKTRAQTSARVRKHRASKVCNADVTQAPLPEKSRVEKSSVPSVQSTRGRSNDIKAVDRYFRESYHPRRKAIVQGSKEWIFISARLKTWSVEDLCRAADGLHRDPFMQGENDRGKTYDTLFNVYRSDDHVTRFIEVEARGDEPVISEKTKRTLRAGESWIKRSEEADRKKQLQLQGDQNGLEGQTELCALAGEVGSSLRADRAN